MIELVLAAVHFNEFVLGHHCALVSVEVAQHLRDAAAVYGADFEVIMPLIRQLTATGHYFSIFCQRSR